MAKLENLKTQTGNDAASILHRGFGRKKRPALADPGIGGVPLIGDSRRMLSVAEFCNRYGIGKTMAYAEMRAGRLRYCQHGKRRLIHVEDAEGWAVSTRKPQPPCGPDSSNRGPE
jgi:Helix-turn-helix domain